MRLYCVRHGESEANILRVISNRGYRYGLTARGQQQAITLAQHLKHVPISGIFSSPLRRAVETADILSRALGRSYHITEALCEYDCGILENTSDDDSWRLHHDIAEDWILHKHWHRKPDQGESFMDISNRFLPFMAHLTQDSIWTDSHMVLIGHGGLFRKVVFENGHEAALADVQIYPSTNKVSFQVRLILDSRVMEFEDGVH